MGWILEARVWARIHFVNLRLKGYPQGLGKGHDAAVVGAWLDEELKLILPTSVASSQRYVII